MSDLINKDDFIEVKIKQRIIRLYIVRNMEELNNLKTLTRKEIGVFNKKDNNRK